MSEGDNDYDVQGKNLKGYKCSGCPILADMDGEGGYLHHILYLMQQDIDVMTDSEPMVREVTAGELITVAAGGLVPVYLSGENEVSRADATDGSGKMNAIGLATATIAAAAEGDIQVKGKVTGLDTSSYDVGDKLYVGTTVGTLTKTAPTHPDVIQEVAVVTKKDASEGEVYINVQYANAGGTTDSGTAAVTDAGHDHGVGTIADGGHSHDAGTIADGGHTHDVGSIADGGHAHGQRETFNGNIEGALTAGNTDYIGSGAVAEKTIEGMFFIVPRNGYIRSMRAYLGTAPGSGENVLMTVRKNGADSSLALTIADTAQSGSQATDVEVAAGDRISISAVVSNNTGQAAADLSIVLDYESTGESATASLSGTSASGTAAISGTSASGTAAISGTSASGTASVTDASHTHSY